MPLPLRAPARAPKSRSFDAAQRAAHAHLPRMLSVATRILGDSDLAHDAVQEALLTLWLAPRVPENLRAWLIRAVVHRSLHARRGEQRRRKWEERAGAEWAEACPLCEPDRDLERAEARNLLDRALAQLTEEQRLVLALRETEGLDYEAIAARLGVPIGTVRSRLNRARAALREELGTKAS